MKWPRSLLRNMRGRWGMTNREREARAYHMGRERREQGGNKIPPATLNWEMRHWWLAGWNDRDLELTPCP